MLLATFPIEVIAHLTEQLIYTDLILLHACGDSLLNSKLKRAPITIRVLHARCGKYFTRITSKRFENIITLIHKLKRRSVEMDHIPPSVKTVVTDYSLDCLVPKSVRKLEARYFGSHANFKSKPGELDVSVEFSPVWPQLGGHNSVYITHLTNHLCYLPVQMPNLKKLTVVNSPNFEPIPGIEMEHKRDCNHMGLKIEGSPEDFCFSTLCSNCGFILSSTSKYGTLVSPIPACDYLLIKGEHFENSGIMIKMMSPKTKTLILTATPKLMSDFCNTGGLDLIPTSVQNVDLILTDPVDGDVFTGVKNVYPFLVIVRSSSFERFIGVRIEDFTGIDECQRKLFRGENEVIDASRTHKRLGIFN